jgi:hypothetical protein
MGVQELLERELDYHNETPEIIVQTYNHLVGPELFVTMSGMILSHIRKELGKPEDWSPQPEELWGLIKPHLAFKGLGWEDEEGYKSVDSIMAQVKGKCTVTYQFGEPYLGDTMLHVT